MSDTPKPYDVNWDDWNQDWIVASHDGEHEIRIPHTSDHDYQGYLIQTALNEIIDRIADDWL